MKLGIVGLPNVGKSTLFNALCNKISAESANYPFCTIEPNVGIINVPDQRLFKLKEIYKPKKLTPATLEFIDIAGLVKGASKGEGLGNKFLSNIREVDAILHVVRCFNDENIIHVENSIDPIRDIDIINIELILSDIEVLQRRIEKLKKQAKADKALSEAIEVLNNLLNWLQEGKPAKSFETSEEFKKEINSIGLITTKKTIYVANFKEEDYKNGIENNENLKKVIEFAEKENSFVLPICAKVEEDLNGMKEEEKKFFLEELGLKESGLDRIIKKSYEILGLISYLTAGEDEVRAWTIKKGTLAPQAAGKIHSDFERGFICAETIAYEDFIKYSNMTDAKEKGVVRTEGKNYEVKDGDIILFRFNV